MELTNGDKMFVNTEEEIEDDKFKAYSYIDNTNYGDYIGVYNSDNETIDKQ